MEKFDTIVLYPSPGMGHLISMVELGKLILTHHPSFSIIIFITNAPYNTGSTAAYINRVSETTPSILFHHLPTISLPLDSTIESPHLETLVFKLLHLNNPNIHQALQTISQSSTIRSFIIDFFCYPSLDVAHNLNIPTYYFFTSGAAVLSVFFYLPTLHKTTTKSFKDLEANLEIPGLPTIPPSDMIKPTLDRTDEAYTGFLETTISLPRSQGIIVNSFESLEPRPIKAISDGLCVPDAPTPPVYYIGPLIASTNDGRMSTGGDKSECLKWLDSQPSRSVVFLCFGSLGLFSATQLKEIAVGLEKSCQRFLWVVRSPPTEDKTKRFLAPPEPNLVVLLPDGFLDRTRDRGLVVKSWAPQVAVLSHKSVGGFVTHCGWNSVLEAVCAGVPMVAWPLYAEQRLNKPVLVEDMKLALPMEESEGGLVSAVEVEKRVSELMDDSDEAGRAIRERVMVMSEAAKVAMSEGGSSRRALDELVESWKLGNLTVHPVGL
ncbi:UDP-glucuronosyl/UDP-glucosyltransferase [Macleaya cordata]|uniref:Glycosyltransferase n=1 Tax=Macleaya cordata TaxID=56857 RepID=A0A200PXS7_MACCD|nr:UDP-glucuronosyl/UDP-glucosyltransferase [Macleaya cordata]